jgi:hypothetical protein
LIKINPLGALHRLDVEETNIATLLEGDQFSRPTNADIKAYTTYEKMKSVVRSVGEINKEQKMKIIKMEKEVDHVQTKSKVEIACERKKYEKLEEKLTKSIEQNKKYLEKIQKFKADAVEQNKKFNAYELEQTYITEKENEKNTSKVKKYEEALEEIEKLKLNLKEKKIQIEKQNAEKRALEYQNGDLAYKLSHVNECKQNFLSLEKHAKKQLKEQLKYYQAEKQKCDESSKQWEIQVVEVKKLLHRQVAEIMTLRQELKNCNDKAELERNIFKEYKTEKEKEITKMRSNEEKQFKEQLKASIQQDIEEFEKNMDEKNEKKFQLMKEIFEADKKELHKEIKKQKLEMLKKDEQVMQMRILKKQCKELQEKNENLQTNLEIRGLNSQVYETPKKIFQNDNVSKDKY